MSIIGRNNFENSSILSRVRDLTLGRLLVYISLYGAAILFIMPYVWMISKSLQTSSEIYSESLNIIPHEITFEWYITLLQGTPIFGWIVNTFIIASVTTLLVLAIDSLVAYSITQLEWPGRRVVFGLIVASFLVPGVANLIPIYTTVANLGLINTYTGIVLPLAANALGVFLLIQFFRDFPEEIIEAARLDGFSTLRIYLQLVLPMMTNILAALGIFTFITTWNNFLWPLIILQEEAKYTVPIGIVTLQDTLTAQQPGIGMASAVIASLPLFILFLLLQNQIIRAVQTQGNVG